MDDHELTPAPEPTPLPVPVKRRSSGNRWLNMLIAVAVLVFVGGVTFAVGRMTAPAQAAGPGNGQFPGLGNGQNGGRFPTGSFDPGQFAGAGLGDRTITGIVTSTDGSTMTLTTAAGQTLTVNVSGSTYHAQTAASARDVSQGTSVHVTVQGGLGFPGGGPGASPGTGATQTLTASDVTIVGH